MPNVKLCVNCVNYVDGYGKYWQVSLEPVPSVCKRDSGKKSLVDGSIIYICVNPENERRENNKFTCGPTGKFFIEKKPSILSILKKKLLDFI